MGRPPAREVQADGDSEVTNEPLLAVRSPEDGAYYCGFCGRGHVTAREVREGVAGFSCPLCHAWNAIPAPEVREAAAMLGTDQG